MFAIIGCDELKDQFSSGSTSEQQTQYMDSLTYFTEGIDSLSLVAIGNHDAIIGVMEDSVYGRTIYVNRESLPQDSAIIMRLDTLERVSFLSFNNISVPLKSGRS